MSGIGKITRSQAHCIGFTPHPQVGVLLTETNCCHVQCHWTCLQWNPLGITTPNLAALLLFANTITYPEMEHLAKPLCHAMKTALFFYQVVTKILNEDSKKSPIKWTLCMQSQWTLGCEPVSFFLRDVKPAMLHRGTSDELVGFIHFQHRDWITRPSCVASVPHMPQQLSPRTPPTLCPH